MLCAALVEDVGVPADYSEVGAVWCIEGPDFCCGTGSCHLSLGVSLNLVFFPTPIKTIKKLNIPQKKTINVISVL